jgi:hypothetical protein
MFTPQTRSNGVCVTTLVDLKNNTLLKAIVFVDRQELSFKECLFEKNDLVSAKDPDMKVSIRY